MTYFTSDAAEKDATTISKSKGPDLSSGLLSCKYILPRIRLEPPFQTRSNSFGRPVLKPFAILSMFTRDTFRIPRSIPL